MGSEVVEDDGTKENGIQLNDVCQWQFSHEDGVPKERESEEKHVVFTGGDSKNIASNFRKWIHGSHALVVEQTGFSFFGSDGSYPTGSQKH